MPILHLFCYDFFVCAFSGGKKKPLKAPKKQGGDVDEVSCFGNAEYFGKLYI